MQPLVNAIIFLGDFIVSTYLYVLVLRLFMQKYRVSWYNPFAQLVIKLTNPLIKPVRRFIPGLAGWDGSIILLLIVIQAIWIGAWLEVSGMGAISWLGVLLVAIGWVMLKVLNVYFILVIVSALMSWLPALQQHPIAELVTAIVQPGLRVVQARMPAIAGFDFSPVVILLMIQLVKILAISPMVAWAASLHG
ncbi:MAG: YggT family protein [Legionellales bacterium]|nr:YggT family protein [Legionellales bacterium]